ncbi:hypothetical protein [Vallitalea guaymasensis]|uniref:hypothetical protein n=1 Tax=Vallitalea guaymasensis TaxID=1185412 RepID=UPI00272A0097|nr:hypothetical protein [Vallitalea guaymasensis]
MNRFIKIIFSFVILAGLTIELSGCSALENDDVKQLKKDLITVVQDNAKDYFNKEIDCDDFDISLSQAVTEDSFTSVINLDNVKKVHFIGCFKDKPEDVIEFYLIYDIENKKTEKFGIKTLEDDEVVYAELND